MNEIAGVMILASEDIYAVPIVNQIVMVGFFVIGFIFLSVVLSLNKSLKTNIVIAGYVCAAACFLTVIGIGLGSGKKFVHTEYQLIITGQVDAKEFLDTYEIIDNNNGIFTVVIKENV